MMSRQERAKQFAPFDALKGLNEELEKRREKHLRVEKRELSEESQNEISAELNKAQPGDEAEIIFYKGGHYYKLRGNIVAVDPVCKCVTVGETKIFFDDIYSFVIV